MISVVVPNYNGAEVLERNLPELLALLKVSRLKFELIVIDDASSDSRVREILENVKGVRVIFREKNGGFPISADQGIREATGDVVFVIKNDSIPEKANYFKLMLDHFKDPKVFAVSAALKTIESGKEELRGNGIIYFEKGLFKHKRGDNFEKITAWADGSASVFRKDSYLKVGGFDKVYRPGYWEDVDLGYRAWKAGYRVEFESKAVLLHDHEAGVYKKKYGEKKIQLINLRNQFIFSLKNSDRSNLWEFFKWEIYNHGTAVKSGNHDFVKAYWMALGRLPEIIKSRIFQSTINRLTDAEVLAKFK